MSDPRRSSSAPHRRTTSQKRAPNRITPKSEDDGTRHHDLISIQRDAGQEVHVTIGETGGHPSQTTGGGRDVDGGYSQLFNRVMSSGIYAALPLPARAVYTALVFLADNGRFFVIDGLHGPAPERVQDPPGVNLDRVMQVSGCGETAVKKAMKTLADRHLIRVLRKGGSQRDGRRIASIYQLLLPVAGLESVHLPEPIPGHVATRYRGAKRPGTEVSGDPVPRRDASRNPRAERGGTGSPRARSTRSQKKRGESPLDAEAVAELLELDDDGKIDTDLAQEMLRDRGVSETMVGRAMDEVSPVEIARRVLDFDIRNRQPGRKKTAGWLAKSVLVGYDLHADTVEFLERQRTMATRAKRRQEHDAAERVEAERHAAIDAWVHREFDAADDEELAIWKRKVIEQYPRLVRGLEDADPKENERLRTLIYGMLAALYPEE